ncbi:MAG: ankyrin repeat domain-containing protein [Nitrospirae bacterium]|nr:ankyrin repeat domain-containing protein [Nitrospirota bacterium]MBF0616196.1 ankyrin repeat domain-containing protein [Nitrospirota bacterium]
MAKIKRLIQNGNDVNKTNFVGMSALHYAAKNGNLEILRELAEAHAELHAATIAGQTPMVFAIVGNKVEIVRYLISNGYEVDYGHDKDDNTCLMIAVSYGYTAIVEMLINNGASIDICNKYGQSALMFSAIYRRFPIMQRLVASGAIPDLADKDGNTALHYAVATRDDDMVDFLIKAGSDPHKTNLKGQTAFKKDW